MGTLILQDGTVVSGDSFGAIGGYEGEVVFNTSMSGYQEIITDPTYAKQIVIMSYPEIGNCGINDFDFESDSPSMVGIIVKNYCKNESHYRSRNSLSAYLKNKNIIALEGIDTRSLIQKIRDVGIMTGFITSNDVDPDFIRRKLEEIQKFKIKSDIILDVSCKNRYIYNPSGEINLAFIDYGVKKSLLASLAKRGCKITVYPAGVISQEITDNDFDAVFLSNGPGDPNNYTYQIAQIKQLIGKSKLFGVGLGCQLLALASDAKVYKLKYGHRGVNQAVINVENNKVMMTSQNHGYAIDSENLTRFMRPTHKNLNDNTLEGFEITSLGIYAVQFEPEGAPGPCESSIILDEWVNIMKRDINRINEVKNER